MTSRCATTVREPAGSSRPTRHRCKRQDLPRAAGYFVLTATRVAAHRGARKHCSSAAICSAQLARESDLPLCNHHSRTSRIQPANETSLQMSGPAPCAWLVCSSRHACGCAQGGAQTLQFCTCICDCCSSTTVVHVHVQLHLCMYYR